MKRRTDHKPVAYVSFDTFISALDNLKGASFEASVKRTDCGSLSSANWGQLARALRFFDLIDERDAPQKSLKLLVKAGDRKPTLRRLLKKHYPELFAPDLSRLSLVKLDRVLKTYGVNRMTIRRARSFVLGAARYSNLPLSAELSSMIRHRTKRNPRVTQSETQGHPQPPRVSPRKSKTVPQGSNMSLTLTFDFAEWEKPERDQLFRLVNELAALNQRATHHQDASPGSDLSSTDELDTLAGDSNDAPVH